MPECHSTNTLALQMSQNPATSEGTIVITHHQTAGRGQRGSTWEAEPGMNLTFSLILRPSFLEIRDQFDLNILVSLAVHDFVQSKVNSPVSIKWPNDILVHEKKICGILIENQIQTSKITAAVAGIGLNINQTEFGIATATSLKLVTGEHTALEDALHELLGFIETRYLQLRQNKKAALLDEYLTSLYWRNEVHTFQHAGELFEGTIQGVNGNGQLELKMNDQLRYFNVKEISFVR